MHHLLIVILDDLGRMPDLLRAWRSIGLPGATILQSAGAYRTTTWLGKVGLGALDRLFEADEVRRRTLLLAIDDEVLLERAIAEAEGAIGGFDRPNSGLLLALPVDQVRGLHKVKARTRPEAPPPPVQPEWRVRRDTPIETIVEALRLEPTLLREDTPLDEAARAMVAEPAIRVACVVNDQGRLVGVLDLHALAEDLFLRIVPEEFLSEITDLDGVLRFAERSSHRTVADAMLPPVWVKRGETVKEAFKRMHERHLAGLPVVDDLLHVVGYINLLELVAACLGRPVEAAR